MKRFAIAIFLMIMVTGLVSAQAAIKFQSLTADFGEIDSGKVVDLKFEFENAGNEILEIKNIQSTCGCAVAHLEKKSYNPGEKGTIPIKFYSRGYQGRVIKAITVASNDPGKPYVQLRLMGNVIMKNFARIEVSPNRMQFEEIPLGTGSEQRFVIRNTGTLPLRIIEVIHGPEISPHFSGKSVGPGEELSGTLHFQAMSPGPFVTYLKIRSNALRQSLVVVKVNATVADPETGEKQ